MELRLLRSFQVLARQGNFGRAARTLQLSQPALTHQVRALEAEVGAPLFDRFAKKVALTEIGQKIFEYAGRLLALADEVNGGPKPPNSNVSPS